MARLNEGKIRSNINGIRRRGKALDQVVHTTAMACLEHAQEHGDITLLTRLVQAMPQSARTKGLIYWAKEHAPIKYSKQKGFSMLDNWQQAPWYLEQADQVPFWDYKPEREPEEFDPRNALKRVVSVMRSRAKVARESGHEHLAAFLENEAERFETMDVSKVDTPQDQQAVTAA